MRKKNATVRKTTTVAIGKACHKKIALLATGAGCKQYEVIEFAIDYLIDLYSNESNPVAAGGNAAEIIQLRREGQGE